MSNKLKNRLEAEAQFQNERILATEKGEVEPRERFYYLATAAREHYDRTIEDVAGKVVVVVGCSVGGVTPIARRGAEVTGIDISDAAIDALNKSIVMEGLQEKASAKLMDAQNLDFPDNSIDLICCTGVLHHLEVEPSAASWSQKLKLNGKVSLLEPMAWNPAVAAYRFLTPSMRTEDEHPLKPRDMRILRKYFARVDIHGYGLTSLVSLVWAYAPNIWNMREKSLAFFSAVDRMLLKVAPWLVYFCWTAVIELSQPKKQTSVSAADS